MAVFHSTRIRTSWIATALFSLIACSGDPPVDPLVAPPSEVVAEAGDASAAVSWSASKSAAAGYRITIYPGEQTLDVEGAITEALVEGLNNGTPYTFTVATRAASGLGPDSAPSEPITPRTTPDAPRAVIAVAGNGQATISWTPPESDGWAPLSGYTLVSLPGEHTLSVAGDLTTATLEGLANETAYTFVVRASNAAGEGPFSEPSHAVTPRIAPGVPTEVSAEAGDASADVSWAPPGGSEGGPVTGYLIVSSPDDHALSVEGGITAVTVEGLRNGTAYTFTVTALNDTVEGPPSSPSNAVTPRTTPGVPTAVSAEAGNGQATISWSAPQSDGGAPLSEYLVVSSPGAQTQSVGGGETAAVVKGLSNGTPYTFTVTAINAAGEGPPSEPSNAVTPRTTPGAPSNVEAIAGVSRATISWSAPQSDGGAPLSGYLVVSSPGDHTHRAEAGETAAVVEGLSVGTEYTFTVAAINVVGEGPPSEPSNPVTPLVAPIPFFSTFVASPSQVLADGVEKITLRLTLRDEENQPLVGRAVSLSSSISSDSFSLKEGVTDAEGLFESDVSSTLVGERLFAASFDSDAEGFSAPVVQGAFLDPSLLCTAESGLESLPWRYAAETNPIDTAIGDFNGDGIPDLAVVDIGEDTLSILLGRGDGSFDEGEEYAMGASPRRVVAGHLNDDDHLDLVVANRDDNKLSVLLGVGDGTFLAPSNLTAGLRPVALALGDLNGDGRLDIVAGNRDGGDVSVHLGSNSSSTGFLTAQHFAVEGQPRDVQVGDLNGDGHLDIVVANHSTSSVSVLFGDGQGDFSPAWSRNYPLSASPSVKPNPVALMLKDLNGDGHLDVVTANEGDYYLSVLLGSETGVLGAGTNFYGQFMSVRDAALADVDGDGRLDLVLASTSIGANLKVLRGQGNGSFTQGIEIIGGGELRSVQVGDLDGDGHLDLILTRGGEAASVQVLRGSGSGLFSPPSQYEAGELSYDVATGDFNGDGLLDLVVANRGKVDAYGSVSVLLNRGNGTFLKERDYVTGIHPLAVAVGDFNGDGFPDIAIVHEGEDATPGSVDLLFGVGGGFFGSQEPILVGASPSALVAADLDGDGLLDLAVVDEDEDTLSVLYGDGAGGFSLGGEYETGRRPGSVKAADLNGDGLPDLLVANWGQGGDEHSAIAGSLDLFLGLGGGAFSDRIDHSEGIVGHWPIDMAVADFNRDGLVDIAVADVIEDEIHILLGIGMGAFTRLGISVPTNPSPNELHVADFNGDGIPDLLSVNDLTSTLNVMLGKGDGRFEAKQTYMVDALGKTGAKAAAVGDFNGDGTLDVAVTMLRAETHLANGAVQVFQGICE